MAAKFVVYQNPTTRLWHWRLRSGANDRDWAVSGQGYTRRERAVAACELVWSKLAGFARCPYIQVNVPNTPELADIMRTPQS